MIFTKVKQNEAEESVGAAIEDIPLEKIRPNPYQPRRFFSQQAIAELSASIKSVGLIQPINVRKLRDDSYELIAGERRLRACRAAGLKTIRAIVLPYMVDQDSAMIAMIENLQRENLNFFEEAEGYLALIREHGFTQEELAKKLSKNQSTIANKLRILRLPPEVKRKIASAGLTERHARALLRLHNERAQLELLETIIKKALSVKETEELVEKKLSKLYGDDEPSPEIKMRVSYRVCVNTVKRTVKKLIALGTAAEMTTEDTGGSIRIFINVPKS